MQFADVVSQRRAVKKYDPNHAISDAELASIFDKVQLAPSSFNLQQCRFVVVREEAQKRALRAAAFGQEQVETASAAVVVVGRLDAHRDAERIYAEAPEEVRSALLPMIEQFYGGNERMQRDEAIRAGALGAMTLMYAALDAGYQSGPMIGFDPAAVAEVVGLDDRHFPVMLVVLGQEQGEGRPRPERLPRSEVVLLDQFAGPGLAG